MELLLNIARLCSCRNVGCQCRGVRLINRLNISLTYQTSISDIVVQESIALKSKTVEPCQQFEELLVIRWKDSPNEDTFLKIKTRI